MFLHEIDTETRTSIIIESLNKIKNSSECTTAFENNSYAALIPLERLAEISNVLHTAISESNADFCNCVTNNERYCGDWNCNSGILGENIILSLVSDIIAAYSLNQAPFNKTLMSAYSNNSNNFSSRLIERL